MPLQDNCVDAVFSRMALHWLPEVEQTLSEFQRVVKPNGLVLADVCTIYNKACLGHIGMPFEEWQEKTNNGTSSDMFPIYHANFKKWMNFFTLPGLQHQFESHGFRLVESVYPYKNTDFPNDEFTDGKESYFENAVILAQKRFSN
jgi:ubiquinone/menaquinone biosynthesis C-methylase UbiE